MINLDNARIGYDLTFEMNNFNQPKLQSEIELVKNVMLYILFSKPGQYPSLPTIGMDIQSLLYVLYDELNVDKLKAELLSQCSALGVYLNNGTIQMRKTKYRGQPSLMINIEGVISYDIPNYLDSVNNTGFMIGITFNELNNMIYNVSNGGAT